MVKKWVLSNRGLMGTFNLISRQALLLALPALLSAQVNLALNKTVAVSSVERSDCPAKNAVDGDPSTRWSSAASDSQWIRVDLGSPQTFKTVLLQWETAYGKSYDIQVSNDTVNWTTVYSTTTGTGGGEEISFTAVTARYVRMYGKTRGTGWGYSLWEFEVGNLPLNLALRHPVRSSSQWLFYTDSNAVDGNLTTEWMADWADTQWIWVDLGSVKAVDRVDLRWGGNYAVSYKLQVSNDTVYWRDVYSTTTDTAGGTNSCPFKATLARYVRLLTTDKAMIGSISLGEFKVYCTTSAPVAVSLRAEKSPPLVTAECFRISEPTFTLHGEVPAAISLYDLRGKLLRRGVVAKGTVDISGDFGLPKGLYFVKIKP